MRKRLTNAISVGVSRMAESSMRFKINSENASVATLRADTGDATKYYQTQADIVVKPEAGKTRWISLPK